MRILLTGANGFIGGHLLAGLQARQHEVVAAVRNPGRLHRKLPGVEAIAVDFNRDTSVETWLPRLAGIDAAINCAGVLHGGRGQDIQAIHATGPIALFDACVHAGVGKVVQISAISADAEAGTNYALTKKRADDHLRELAVEWTVLRPSLVYGEGSYGGTSTLRGLAGVPLVTPLVGDGSAPFRPIHVADLVETVVRVVEADRQGRRTLEPVGPRLLTLREIVATYRGWLGLSPAVEVFLPLWFVCGMACLVDLAGGGPMGNAGLQQLLAGNAGRETDGVFARAIGFEPSSLDERLALAPAQTQDLWHARLYFLAPLLRLALALMWLGSSVVGMLALPAKYETIAPTKAAWFFCAIDFLIGLALLFRLRMRLVALAQLIVVGGYTVGLTVLSPGLWLDPFGPLIKNIPIIAVIAVWAALEEER